MTIYSTTYYLKNKSLITYFEISSIYSVFINYYSITNLFKIIFLSILFLILLILLTSHNIISKYKTIQFNLALLILINQKIQCKSERKIGQKLQIVLSYAFQIKVLVRFVLYQTVICQQKKVFRLIYLTLNCFQLLIISVYQTYKFQHIGRYRFIKSKNNQKQIYGPIPNQNKYFESKMKDIYRIYKVEIESYDQIIIADFAYNSLKQFILQKYHQQLRESQQKQKQFYLLFQI
ncbi:transmembrane protein, putative (macronuclear) [Tetrahymena thermophila SB210]|uniref:Transmembrane protein, putative n=1 Tax=Tetrahymena thermophila (strain SB210) TaxID=312017 RepID=W7WXN9_TETTS|nr:transmembrane protein, putative [Tetrahymena thermophila SB210]EWS71605.1 transmembrane protein, putative [Tetrahymena thermophila SB210]|eukprot:XP_012655850.1 transmembrane protein, putative [Tetrahymena thermophila SB210]